MILGDGTRSVLICVCWLPVHVHGKRSILLMSDLDIQEGNGRIDFFLICELDITVDWTDVCQHIFYSISWNCIQDIVHIPFPEHTMDRWWHQSLSFHFFHHNIGNHRWHRRTHGCTMDLLIKFISILKVRWSEAKTQKGSDGLCW